jgi:hypothetical protein
MPPEPHTTSDAEIYASVEVLPMAAEDWPPLPTTIAVALGIVGGIASLGWALAQILPAIGVMIGLVITVGSTGLATAGPVASWTVPAASIGLTAAGGSAVIVLLVKAAKEASSEPYEWAVPLLGITGGVMLDMAKDFGIDNDLLKTALTAVVAFLVVVAGACWKSPRMSWKLTAVILLIVPPAALLVRNVDVSGAKGLADAFRAIPVGVWGRLGAFLGIGVIVAINHYLVHRPGETRGCTHHNS